MSFPTIDPSEVGMTGLLWLVLSYGFVLYYSSNLISEGSDLLLLVPSLAGLVGSVVLPFLGAVPDGAIMLFSGLGDIEDAQETLSVGVGALAGSTIMLLTVPWALSVIGGRVDLNGPNNEPNYKGKPKLTEASLWSSLGTTGVALTPEVNQGAKLMMITTLPYFLIQGPAYFLSGSREEISYGEHTWALAGFITCSVLFVGYLALNIKTSNEGADKLRRTAVIKKALNSGALSLAGAMAGEFEQIEATILEANKTGENIMLKPTVEIEGYPPPEIAAALSDVVREAFRSYDSNNDHTLQKKEFATFLTDFNESVSAESLNEIFSRFDKDNSGTIDFDEFIAACYIIVKLKCKEGGHGHGEVSAKPVSKEIETVHECLFEDSNEEEEEEVPDDIAYLPPDQQQFIIKKRAFLMLASGTALVLIFSDPMVEVMNEIAIRADIPAFYVSFILAPLASNASEVIASQYYAAKKTRKTITVSLTALEGAASMNNTFCLAIFMALIYFRGLAWSYSAETIAIILVQIIIAFLAQKKVMTCSTAFVVLAMFPLSIVLVWGLEALGMD